MKTVVLLGLTFVVLLLFSTLARAMDWANFAIGAGQALERMHEENLAERNMQLQEQALQMQRQRHQIEMERQKLDLQRQQLELQRIRQEMAPASNSVRPANIPAERRWVQFGQNVKGTVFRYDLNSIDPNSTEGTTVWVRRILPGMDQHYPIRDDLVAIGCPKQIFKIVRSSRLDRQGNFSWLSVPETDASWMTIQASTMIDLLSSKVCFSK